MEDFQQLIDKNDKKLTTSKKNDKCLTYIIAKKYIEKDELEEDNNKEIYFDKNYDKTVYDIAKEYKKEQS